MNEQSPSEDSPRFGSYEVQGLIGNGATANVYRAVTSDGQKVALKVLARQRVGDSPVPVATFLREAEQLARIDHPNVIGLVGHGLCAGRAYVAMDYFEGTTLEQLFLTRPPSPERLIGLLIRVCSGLAEAHRQGLLHRDVKPSNILVDDADEVKLVDFGLAKEFGDGVSMTGDGVLLGTPVYMSPEQIRGRPLDGRCDIYAIGAVLYTGLAGRPPFLQRQTAALLMAHLNDEVAPLSEVAPGQRWPKTLERVIARCLAKSRTDRFDTMEQLIEALEASRLALANPTRDDVLLGGIAGPRGVVGARRLARPSYLTGLLALPLAAGFVYVLGQGYDALTAPVVERPRTSAAMIDAVPLDASASSPEAVETFEPEPLVSVQAPPVEPLPSPPPLRDVVLPPPPRAEGRLRHRRTDLKNPFPSLETP